MNKRVGLKMQQGLELQKVVRSLLAHKSSHIAVRGSEIDIRISDEGEKIKLVTSVYIGGNYLPISVREALIKKQPFNSNLIRTDHIVDEEKFEISLQYTGFTENFNLDRLKTVIEEFAWLAEEWRLLLDEEDRNDRVPIHV